MPWYAFHDKRPRVAASAFVHPQAVLIGDVVIGEGCYIGAGAVLRADFGRISIGDGSNFQDNAVAHGEVTIGAGTLVAHGCVVHYAKLGDRVTVGIGSIIMDGCEIGDGCIVGAGSLVLFNTKVPPGKLVVGSPAKVLRDVGPEAAQQAAAGLAVYQALPRMCFEGLQQIEERRAP